MEIEDYLSRFEPVSPPPRLRGTVLHPARPRRPWRPLLVAAALAVPCGLWLVNERSEARLAAALRPAAARAPERTEPPALASLIRLRLEIGRRS